MLNEIASYIEKEQLLTAGKKILIGVSGGVDSMTLLHVLNRLGYQLTAAHMNFSLRGREADKDEALVKKTCEQLKVPFVTDQVDTHTHARAYTLSIQMAARELRYQWFDSLMQEKGIDILVTAHNANDNLETILFNLTKGTGIRGIRGIKPKDGKRERPLLFASKDQILHYAQKENISWREDASNVDAKYLRNKIRHEVIPTLIEINPALIEHFENTRSRLQGVEDVFMQHVDSIRQQYCQKTENGWVIRLGWTNGDDGDALILSELLRDFGFSYTDCQSISRVLELSGKVFYSQQYVLNVDRASLIIQRRGAEIVPQVYVIDQRDGVSWCGEWSISNFEKPIQAFTKQADPNEIFLDADLVEFPLTIRPWKPGDTFHPLGLRGKKKISDFLIDEKVPLIDKKSVVLLESAGKVCWVVNHRLDERFKVTAKTTRLLKITCQKSFDDGLNPV